MAHVSMRRQQICASPSEAHVIWFAQTRRTKHQDVVASLTRQPTQFLRVGVVAMSCLLRRWEDLLLENVGAILKVHSCAGYDERKGSYNESHLWYS